MSKPAVLSIVPHQVSAPSFAGVVALFRRDYSALVYEIVS